MLQWIKAPIGATALIVMGAGLAAAQENCPRGTLDAAYCDRNGDLVADAPSDPKKLINPSTIIFSYTPVEDPAVCTLPASMPAATRLR